MNKTILVVDDEYRMRRLIGDYLKKEGFTVLEADNGADALLQFKKDNINLVILDIMMPRLNGYEVLKSIRQSSRVPILMVTAKSEESDELLGFDLGVDDYVTKPFSPKILVAKVKAIFNRLDEPKQEEVSMITIGNLSINELSHCVYLSGDVINLSPKEYDLLLYLAKNKDIALSRDKILDNVWGIDYYGDYRTVDTHIKRLREKLQSSSDLISTVRGSGYKMEGPKA